MKLIRFFSALIALIALGGNAAAATFTGASGSGSNVVDYSSDSLLSFDLDLVNFSPVTLNFVVDADDLSSPYLSFNFLARNLTGDLFERFHVSLNGVTFSGIGTVTPTFGTLVSSGSGATAAWVIFSPPEPAELYFGNPLGLGGQSDWVLNLSGKNNGDVFTITTAVPEPATWMTMLAGLTLLGYSAIRRRDGK